MVWRQFLLFCLRNGLFYGESGDEILEKKDDCSVVRCLPDREIDKYDYDDNVTVVGSLERSIGGRDN
jgi:hypothetical protein